MDIIDRGSTSIGARLRGEATNKGDVPAEDSADVFTAGIVASKEGTKRRWGGTGASENGDRKPSAGPALLGTPESNKELKLLLFPDGWENREAFWSGVNSFKSDVSASNKFETLPCDSTTGPGRKSYNYGNEA